MYHLKPLYTQAMRTVKPLYIQAMFLLIRQKLINESTKTNQLSDHGWPPDSQITKFANYMVETFVGDDAMFPHYSRQAFPMTTETISREQPVVLKHSTQISTDNSRVQDQNMYALTHKLMQLQEQNYVTLQTVQKCAEI